MSDNDEIETGLTVHRTNALVTPAASIKEVQELFRQFQQAKKDLLEPEDFQQIGDSSYIKKSGWISMKTFFGVSLEVLKEQWVDLPGGERGYQVVVRAERGGVFADGIGFCDTTEDFYRRGRYLNRDAEVPDGVITYELPNKEGEWVRYLPKPLSSLIGFAATRANNRAISTLVGGGENSAEEMSGGGESGQRDQRGSGRQRTATRRGNGGGQRSPFKIMKATRDGDCRACTGAIYVGDQMAYSSERGANHPQCVGYEREDRPAPPPPEPAELRRSRDIPGPNRPRDEDNGGHDNGSVWGD